MGGGGYELGERGEGFKLGKGCWQLRGLTWSKVLEARAGKGALEQACSSTHTISCPPARSLIYTHAYQYTTHTQVHTRTHTYTYTIPPSPPCKHTHAHIQPQLSDEGRAALVEEACAEVASWFTRLDCLLIGPGLGRDPLLLDIAKLLIMQVCVCVWGGEFEGCTGVGLEGECGAGASENSTPLLIGGWWWCEVKIHVY